jgi:penicillin-binding protein 2
MDLRGPARKVDVGLQRRLYIAMGVLVVAFAAVGVRLYTLQVVRGDEFQSRGRRNYVQRIEVDHDRGILFDRNGEILADNRPSFDVVITPRFLGSAGRDSLARLARHLGLTRQEEESLTLQIAAIQGAERLRPRTVARDLDPGQVEAIEADRSLFLLDGVEVVQGRRRLYKGGALAAHVLGFLNEIGPQELEEARRAGNPLDYQRGDLVGRRGVEHAFEASLRGRNGWQQVIVDANGRRVRDGYVASLLPAEAAVAPEPGHNVYLTLDARLQRAAEAAFDGQAGAVVALDPRDGSVLAMASFPTYDPNRIGGALTRETSLVLDSDPLKPRLHRALQGMYAPGSTFKVATALAALVERATRPDESVHCPGYYRLGNRAWRCHKDEGHGHVDLREAIMRSCDTYFYQMAARMGIEPIAKAARQLGFGRVLDVGLQEREGLVPDEAYHDRVQAEGYQRGMALNTAIGQGSVLVTPLQLAVAYSALVNGGTLWRPRLLMRVETADFRVERRTVDGVEVQGPAPGVVQGGEAEAVGVLQATALGPIREGLLAVMAEPGGTGYSRRSQHVTMGGKTGTAQVVRMGTDRLDAADVPYEQRDHALFVGYAPQEDPHIVVAVINEHSGHGGAKAAPIAVRVIDAFIALREAMAAIP